MLHSQNSHDHNFIDEAEAHIESGVDSIYAKFKKQWKAIDETMIELDPSIKFKIKPKKSQTIRLKK